MHPLVPQIALHQKKALARAISVVENELDGYEDLLQSLPGKHTPVIGITGPPGAGKSTLINALTSYLLSQGKKLAIVAVDPSSPFNRGSLLGDRVRMSEHFLNPDVFIRSMASRGSLGGLAPKILEVTDVLRAAWFDYIFIETVGVGQSEVEVAGLADTTIVTLVPEAGDDIQTIKSGVMEIADIFVLNKSDREGADTFYRNLAALTHAQHEREIAVVKTVATRNEGMQELVEAINKHQDMAQHSDRKAILLAEKALTLIKNKRTADIRFNHLVDQIRTSIQNENFNLYRFVSEYRS